MSVCEVLFISYVVVCVSAYIVDTHTLTHIVCNTTNTHSCTPLSTARPSLVLWRRVTKLQPTPLQAVPRPSTTTTHVKLPVGSAALDPSGTPADCGHGTIDHIHLDDTKLTSRRASVSTTARVTQSPPSTALLPPTTQQV
eukprot:GHVS01069449.1.p3 GENE.GHVS01069449.1~~GHVS01069449.1.p3  ORF type:complete len:140 (+),score=19.63 GHVS01069449.1:784-1203(+)